tara:strand:+ start:265 stop:1893 length:1629 start_codon:yes stop_codon:yes gene_type:complete
MNIIVDISILYTITSLSFFTIVGYGDLLHSKLLRNSTREIFYIFFWGIIFLFIIQFFLYLIFKITFLSNFLIIILGILLFFKSRNKYKNELKFFFILLACLIVVLIISKTHEDFKHHHLQTVSGIFNQKISLGKGNLNPQFIYTPTLAYVIAIFKFPKFENNFFHVVPFLTYLSFLGYIYFNLKKTKNKNLKISFLISLIFCLITFKTLKNYGFDITAFFFGAICIFEYVKSKKYYSETLLFFVFACSIKITTLFSLPFFAFIYLKDILKNYKLTFFKNRIFYSFIFILICVIFASFLDNACIIYFIKNSCLDYNQVSWAIDKNLIDEISTQTELDTKGFFSQNLIIDKNLYLKNFNWVHYWLNNSSTYKVLNFILIYFGCIILVIFFNKVTIKKNFKIYELILSLSGVIFWFLKLPTLRYGYLPIFSSFFFIHYLFINFNENRILKKKLIILISLIIIWIHNYNRISDEFNRADANYFKNFPWYYLPERIIKKRVVTGGVMFEHKDNLGAYPCWNIPWPCWEPPKDIIMSDKFFFTIYEIK